MSWKFVIFLIKFSEKCVAEDLKKFIYIIYFFKDLFKQKCLIFCLS